MIAKESDYFNLTRCLKTNVTFNFIIGGRGTGKTYGTLSHAIKEKEIFCYMRRMEAEVSTIAREELNPFKALNRDKGWNIQAIFKKSNGIGTFFDDENIYGYATAISTFGKLRGADMSDVELIIYDEFIRAKNQRPILEEASCFFNAYETIARNRELMGKQAVKVYLLSNSTSMSNPILSELGLVNVIENMKKNGDKYWTDRSIETHIELLDDLEISKKKATTALYKLTNGTKYKSHAIENEFAYDSFENIRKVPLAEYYPYIQVEDLYIYRHKKNNKLYVTKSKSKCPVVYTGDSIPLFRRTHGLKLHQKMLDGTCEYSTFDVKDKVLSYFNTSS